MLQAESKTVLHAFLANIANIGRAAIGLCKGNRVGITAHDGPVAKSQQAHFAGLISHTVPTLKLNLVAIVLTNVQVQRQAV